MSLLNTAIVERHLPEKYPPTINSASNLLSKQSINPTPLSSVTLNTFHSKLCKTLYALHLLSTVSTSSSYSDITYSLDVSFPTVTFTLKYSKLPVKPTPYSENNAAVIVALPSGLLVGMLTFAVILPMMLEFSIFQNNHVSDPPLHFIPFASCASCNRSRCRMFFLTRTQKLLPHERA